MTEQEWLTSNDPQAMLRLAERTSNEGMIIAIPRQASFRVSDRKLRLFACACVRQVWHLLTDKRSRNAVETAERFADGLATDEELRIASDAASDAAWATASDAARKTQANLLRDIGNPFRHTQILAAIRCPSIQHQIDFGDDPLYKPICRQCGGTARRSWLTPTVKGLAQAAYEERGENGHLDPDRLLILADALEEAGCDCEEILRHLRSKDGEPSGCPRCEFTGRLVVPELPRGWQYCPFCADKPNGPHVRGCWVVDLLLGKE